MTDLIAPAPHLTPYVQAYWRRRGAFDQPRTLRVLPDATLDIIWEFAGAWAGRAYVVGAQLKPILVPLSGQVDRIGVRLQAGMAPAVLGRPVGDLRDRFAPLDDLSLGCPELFERLAEAEGLAARARLLDAWLTDRILRRAPDRRIVEETAAVATALAGGAGPKALLAATGWSERRLQRVCRGRFGASAATLHRWRRFDLAVSRLEAGRCGLARLAADLGYADQAHMSRDFHHFAGVPIGAWLAERAGVGFVQAAR